MSSVLLSLHAYGKERNEVKRAIVSFLASTVA